MIYEKKGVTSVWLLALLVFWAGVGGDGPSSVIAADESPVMSRPEDNVLDDLSEDEAWLAGEDEFLDDQAGFSDDAGLADPLEPLNRVFFYFNDKLYYFVVKPVSTVYDHVVAEGIRISIRNFFKNLSAPVRVVNNLLQGKVKGTGVELARFTINTTVGIAGLGDPARDMGLMPSEEDLGQTLGVYGIGDGIYLHWPVFGPSSLRDTVGKAGDAFLEPLTYLTAGEPAAGIGIYSGKRINNSSLALGDYELFKKTSIDPYTAMRNAYYQFRQGRIHDLSPKDGDLLDRGVSVPVTNKAVPEERQVEHMAGPVEEAAVVAEFVSPDTLDVSETDVPVTEAPEAKKDSASDTENQRKAADVAIGQSASSISLSRAVKAVAQRVQTRKSRVRIIDKHPVIIGISQRSSLRIIPIITKES